MRCLLPAKKDQQPCIPRPCNTPEWLLDSFCKDAVQHVRAVLACSHSTHSGPERLARPCCRGCCKAVVERESRSGHVRRKGCIALLLHCNRLTRAGLEKRRSRNSGPHSLCPRPKGSAVNALKPRHSFFLGHRCNQQANTHEGEGAAAGDADIARHIAPTASTPQHSSQPRQQQGACQPPQR